MTKKYFFISLLLAWASVANAIEIDGVEVTFDENRELIRTPKNEEVIKLIPTDFKFINPGKLTVAVAGLNSPPLYLFSSDNKTLIGSEVDMARIIADTLGLELEVIPTSWEDWPLGVISGKYDAAISNITVTKARKEKFDFATYREDSLGFYVKKDSPIESIKEPKDIAGLKIVVGSGTNQEAILLAWDAENRAKGLEPFTPVYSRDDAASTLALQSGRADATFGPYVMGAFKASLKGDTKLVGQVNGGWPIAANIGVTLKKGNGLVVPIQAAINSTIENGTYAEVLTRWGEINEQVARSEINPKGLGD